MLNVFAFFHSQQVVELEGYVIILVEGRDGKIKLYGSPADRDGLEVADEILDVNERKLDDVPRALVIKHIHEVSGMKGLGGN
jgi:MAGUK p55 subfamily protein 5